MGLKNVLDILSFQHLCDQGFTYIYERWYSIQNRRNSSIGLL